MTYKVKAGTVLFASDDTALEEAKAFISRYGYTNDDVAIKKFKQYGDYWINVVAKKEIEIK